MTVSKLSLLGRACVATTLSMAGDLCQLLILLCPDLVFSDICRVLNVKFDVNDFLAQCFPHCRARLAGGDFICQIILRGSKQQQQNQQQQQQISTIELPSLPPPPVAPVSAPDKAATLASSRHRLPVPESAQVWLQVRSKLCTFLRLRCLFLKTLLAARSQSSSRLICRSTLRACSFSAS